MITAFTNQVSGKPGPAQFAAAAQPDPRQGARMSKEAATVRAAVVYANQLRLKCDIEAARDPSSAMTSGAAP